MIHLRTFNLEKISESKHYSLIRNAAEDENVRKYISKDFLRWINFYAADNDDNIEVKKSYVIERDNNYIGFIGSLDFSSDGVLELWCVIDKEFRDKGNADKILGEITPYYIEHIDGLNDICLKINKYNIASQKVALKNGYTKVGESDGIYKYTYFGKKK